MMRIFWLIGLGATFLAILNLVHREAWISSILWLIFVTVVIGDGIREVSWAQFWVDRLGELGGRRYAECEDGELRLGFRQFGRKWIQLRVAFVNIRSVEWSMGQASGMAGRDMSDWSAFVRYEVPRSVRELKGARRARLLRFHTVASLGKKAKTEEYGLSFVQFLRGAGVALEPGGSDHQYLAIRDPRLEAKKTTTP